MTNCKVFQTGMTGAEYQKANITNKMVMVGNATQLNIVGLFCQNLIDLSEFGLCLTE